MSRTKAETTKNKRRFFFRLPEKQVRNEREKERGKKKKKEQNEKNNLSLTFSGPKPEKKSAKNTEPKTNIQTQDPPSSSLSFWVFLLQGLIHISMGKATTNATLHINTHQPQQKPYIFAFEN